MVAAGLTNAALAAKLGVAENTVNRWRNRWRRPREKIMGQIRDVSEGQVTPNDFFVADDKLRAAPKRASSAPRKRKAVQRSTRPRPSIQAAEAAQ